VAKLDCPDRVNDVAFSPDGKLIAAGYGWNTQGGVKVWDVASRTVVAALARGKGEHESVNRVAFSPDGKLFAAANFDGDVALWAVGSWRRLKTVIFRGGSPTSLSFSPDGTKLAFSSDFAVILYDLKSARANKIAARTHLSDYFSGASFSPDGKSLAVGMRGAIQFWDVATLRPAKHLRTKATDFFCRFSPQGKYLIAGGGAILGKRSIVVWDVEDEEPVSEVSQFRSGLFALAIAHSGKLFALGGGNYGPGGDLSVWSLSAAQEVAFVSFGQFPIEGLAFSPDDTLLAAASQDGFVLLYDVNLLRGPQRTKQTQRLCGEILAEGERVFIVPLSEVPMPMSKKFDYAWKLELADASPLTKLAGFPIQLTDWEIESNAATDRARATKFLTLLSVSASSDSLRNYVVLGDVRNPGWNEGFIAKVYGDDSFVATNNSGACLAHGPLNQLQPGQNLEAIKARLLAKGFMSIPEEPATRGLDHYRTRFIELSINGVRHLRTDAEVVDFARKRPAKKEEDFRRIFDQEEPFVSSILRAGSKLSPN
jgi:WD40 repeat protein